MDYTFQPFLDELGTNWYDDDTLLATLVARHAGAGAAGADGNLRDWGALVAGRLSELAEESARPENAPRLQHRDPFGRRVDEIVLPASTLEALAEVEGRHGMGACHGDPFTFYAKAYLCWQNGEAGVACSMACTDGLVRALDALGDRPEHAHALEHVRRSSVQRVWHGAQFVTEAQGGSDVPANALRASPAGDEYRLHGAKWFCSNINADYFLVTARDCRNGAAGDIGLFLVPAFLPDEGTRNGYTIDRLKDKLGTRELATAEVTFQGAVAYPLGPLERGLSNLLRYVLTTSRVGCVISAAAALRRAERIATTYARFRTAFGRPIASYPLVQRTLADLGRVRERALAVMFGLLRSWEDSTRGNDTAAVHEFRVMLSLSKVVLTREATMLLHEAMMLLGGNGVEERFSPLPRLYRDSVIMETWEGPHNVLLTQALRDLKRFRANAGDFVERVAGPGHDRLQRELAVALDPSADTGATLHMAALAPALVHAYGERLLEDVTPSGTAQ